MKSVPVSAVRTPEPSHKDTIPFMFTDPGKNKKHALRDWIQSVGQGGTGRNFGDSAQAALDRATGDTADETTSGRGSLYRHGCTLADLKPGECGTIQKLLGNTQGRLRLLEMGLTPGVHVKVVRAASFGGPLDVTLRGYQLSLRRDEAALLWLDDDDDERAPVGAQ